MGNLVLGDAALNEMMEARHALQPIDPRIRHYAGLADAAMHGGLPGSSAQGEHPKFAAFVSTESGPRQMLVKFSPPTTTPAGRRWADLLIAEHHAHSVINEHSGRLGWRACQSRVVADDTRLFLEMERFDRIGASGRRGVTSLYAIDAERYGRLDDWSQAGARLFHDGHIDATNLRQLQLASAFGMWIGNTDRHFGNVSFFDDYDGRFNLAPTYDMLPMLFAPEHDQVLARTFAVPHATADTLEFWDEARTLATQYWEALTRDERVSEEFRRICGECLAMVRTAS